MTLQPQYPTLLVGLLFSKVIAVSPPASPSPLTTHCHLGLGTLYAKIGQREQVCAALSTAIELYRAMGMTFWLPQAEATLAQVA